MGGGVKIADFFSSGKMAGKIQITKNYQYAALP